MSTRLYFLVADETAAGAVVEALRGEGLSEDDISAVAHRREYPLEGLPEGGIAARTDVLPAARDGAAAGGVTGMLAGLTATIALAPGMVVGGPALVAALAGVGTAFGTWASTLVGVGVLHRDLEPFEEAIERGEILLLVDVETDRADAICTTIRRRAGNVTISEGELAEAS
jgi:hypothetical protein